MVDTADLKSASERSPGSSPGAPTTFMNEEFAERIIISVKQKLESQDSLDKQNAQTLLNLAEDLLYAYVKEKYKTY